MRKVVTLLFLTLLLANCFAVIEQDSIDVFAVTDKGNALTAQLIVKIEPGTGKVWTNVEPLVGTSTQSTEKLAVKTARDYSSVVDKYDYFFEIDSDASLVEGPSAGAAMTLLVISMLQDKIVPDNVALTGTITTGGSVGPVGGVFEKSKEAAKIGIKLFMVPPGEIRQTVKIDNTVQSINLIDYSEKNWGLKVVEVKNIDEVLHYAFADIESIDVNSTETTIDFVPKQLELSESLLPMKTLTQRYISNAEGKIRSAKTALSGTMLGEATLIDTMLKNLNESEKMLAKSKILFEQNYLYSSANYAFLAMASSNFVKDIAENPDLLSSSSTAFNNKLQDLDKKLNSLAFDLNRFVTVDYFEWHVASKERLSWAKVKLEQLRAMEETIIIIEQDGVNWQRVNDIMEYQYALAWHDVSRDFFEMTQDSKRGILPDNALQHLVDSYVVNSENGLSALSEEESEAILRRLDGAKISISSGWTYAALFDSASSLALINAAIFSKNKSMPELQNALSEKINLLQQKIEGNRHSFVWAQLYLDHSKYYLDSTLFYQEQQQTALALTNAKNGIELIFLAEAVFEAANASYTHFDTLPRERFLQVTSGWQQRPLIDSVVFSLLLAMGLVICIMFFAIVASGKRFHLLKPFSFEDRLDEILLEQRKLRKRLEKGYLSKQQFDSLNAPMQTRINRLLAERRALSSDYVKLDLNKSKVVAFERALRDLKMQLNKGLITAEDFNNNAGFYKRRVAFLKHEIAEEQKKISGEKKKVEKEFSAVKKLAKQGKNKRS